MKQASFALCCSLAVLGLAPLVSACNSDPPQFVVYVATDAPIPSWGDRVYLEVLDDEGHLACDDCRREIAVTAESFPVSFGMVRVNRASVHVRARLYRSSQAGPDGSPKGTALIDMLGRAPGPVDETVPLVVYLPALCFGVPSDLAAHTSCTVGDATTPAGTVIPEPFLGEYFGEIAIMTPGAIDRFGNTCPAETTEGMACVPPRAFILGEASTVGVDTDYPAQPEIVRQPIFPILVDIDEMTVGAVRQLVRTGKLRATADGVQRRGDAGVPAECTYLGETNAANDALPMNCISRDKASLACLALDKELLTEIDWELAASNGGRGSRFPWGDEASTCDRAVLSVDSTCVRKGPVAGGSENDVNALGLKNLGGNLSEWVSDIFVPYTDECWGLILDTSGCTIDARFIGWRGPWPHRGGSWKRRGSSAASFARFASPNGAPSPEVGFRCKKSVAF